MKIDRQQAAATKERQEAWRKQYQSLLKEYVASLGGDAISPTMRATAKVLATLSTELSLLSARFATDGRGASPEDLSLFLKLTDKVADLLDRVGLAPKPQDHKAESGEEARAVLERIINGIIREREEEEARDIFRDRDGNIVTDPAQLEIERQIYTLRHGHPPQSEAVAVPAPPKRVPQPEPVTLDFVPREKTSTELWYEWSAQQASRFP